MVEMSGFGILVHCNRCNEWMRLEFDGQLFKASCKKCKMNLEFAFLRHIPKPKDIERYHFWDYWHLGMVNWLRNMQEKVQKCSIWMSKK